MLGAAVSETGESFAALATELGASTLELAELVRALRMMSGVDGDTAIAWVRANKTQSRGMIEEAANRS